MQSSRRRTISKLSPILLFAFGILFGSPVMAQGSVSFQPYTVYVAQEESHARCGPSATDYRTDELRHGQALEVYYEGKDGWLGIRPPESAFSWIPADTVEREKSSNTGVVIEDRTVAWIGTHLGRARSYNWQVQLSKGEPVTIIGKSEREGPDGPQLWYRIVPPSGEFRWIHRDQVVINSEQLIETMAVAQSQNEIMFAEAGPTSPRTQSIEPKRTARPAAQPIAAKPASSRRTHPSGVAQASGESVLENDADDMELMPIGSGLRDSWKSSEPSEAEDSRPRTASVELESPPSLAPSPSLGVSQQTASQQPPVANEPTRRKGLIASVAFLGRPTLTPIGTSTTTAIPPVPNDDNWTSGAARTSNAVASAEAPQPMSTPTTAIAQPSVATQQSVVSQSSIPVEMSLPAPAPPASTIMQVSGQAPMPAQNLVPQPMASPAVSGWMPAGSMPAAAASSPLLTTASTLNVVPAQRIAQIKSETANASVDQLTITLSRLMAGQASALETEPVATAARTIARSATDANIASQARLLADRAEQYALVATRRDGNSMIRNQGDVVLADATMPIGTPTSLTVPELPIASFDNAPATATQTAATADTPTYGGQLVQVYSARPHSPPFALTDGTGRTVAYVTPVPGVNLRSHLNSRVNVVGTVGYLPGLNMPHVMASHAVRIVE
ncbi:hypothetical protein Poly51_08630 [Rubripirellula tenax]|uniref:Bacterial SH3 domain protein n=1 Tax=Rubripirellula tenax TaxID=2528015 RepID=A0A5C6FIF6_9BACT|nr:hypothetical protein [Rubripirellula tenax]TWU60585.1 hypothetical protein Poly51_08630 [Rubripirellula tenax]